MQFKFAYSGVFEFDAPSRRMYKFNWEEEQYNIKQSTLDMFFN